MPKKKQQRSEEDQKKHDAAVEDIIDHFNKTYISTGNNCLSAFQELCKDLDVEVGPSIKKCRQVS